MKNTIVDLNFVRKKRLENGLSIEEVSNRLGYSSYQAYHRKENGQRELSVEDLVKLSKILNEPIENFFDLKITNMVI